MDYPKKFAVIIINNHQYKVAEGFDLDVQKIEGEPGTKLEFTDVLLKVNDKDVTVGKPTIAKSKVTAEIVEQFKDKKVTINKFKAKARYRKKIGHRQQLTKIKIKKIT